MPFDSLVFGEKIGQRDHPDAGDAVSVNAVQGDDRFGVVVVDLQMALAADVVAGHPEEELGVGQGREVVDDGDWTLTASR